MDTRSLEKFAQAARRQLTEQVTARLQHVLQGDSADLRARAEALDNLRAAIDESSRAAVVERVAYTWFNRFCALRFMDANRYTPLGIVSPAPGHTQPELLQEAKAGQIDASLLVDTERVLGLLGEHVPSPDPQQEAYRLLLVAACNSYHAAMPFLFEKIDDWSELLLPDDLLSANSVLHGLRAALSEEACQDVEVIGWLYQFYIAEKKEAVDAKVKAGGKVTADELPAKTALYTPDWIVRFLVENSLGRLWLLNRPQSQLAAQMRYYIAPDPDPGEDAGEDGAVPTAHDAASAGAQGAAGEGSLPPPAPLRRASPPYLPVASPEELRVADSACGSGHMLLYAFDLLHAIYAEEGYNPPDIPRLILEHNLYGVEIDERSAALAAFALTMKARRSDRRFLRRGVHPHICDLHSVHFAKGELQAGPWIEKLGSTPSDRPVREALLHDLAAAALLDEVGSLLRPQLTPAQIERVRTAIQEGGDLFTQEFARRVLDVLAQMEYLARRYHVVVTNPPYLGKGMSEQLGDYAQAQYPDSKADTFAMFIERNLDLARQGGLVGMITMQSWMFLSSYEKLRNKLLEQDTLLAMAHLGAKAFDSIGGEVVSTTAFVTERQHHPAHKGSYARLVAGDSEAEKEAMLRAALAGSLYRVSAADFKKIPGAPIAYWVSEAYRCVFNNPLLATEIETEGQNKTADNDQFLRQHWEIGRAATGRNCTWLLYAKGGSYRKWYGNLEHVVLWTERARSHYRQSSSCRIVDEKFWYREGVTWTDITSRGTAFRYLPGDTTFDMSGPTAFFSTSEQIYSRLGLLNSAFVSESLPILNPTLHAQLRDIKAIPKPILGDWPSRAETVSRMCVEISRSDWDSYETSWDFTTLPLLRPVHRGATLAATYAGLRRHWQSMTDEMRRLETENNRIFIDAYGLQDELAPDVPLEEITLTGNPHYRYGAGKSEAEYARLQAADTVRELVSYAVGCMFGRYSLDKPGLILANAGQSLADYLAQVPDPTFLPDKDNVIPVLPGDWFADDAPERFKRFLRTAFGDAHFAENLKFVEDSLGRDIRSYFLREFYDHHVRTYQKRPIYWLFSSPKGGFNALVYLHRYRPDTVSIVLNEYLREYIAKLQARRTHLQQLAISVTATPGDKSKAIKEVDGIDKTLVELRAYEDDVLYPLAARQVRLDLDDGVKVNYGKLGRALKRIAGLDA